MAKAKTAKVRSLDMTKVKERGEFNPKHMPEGDYVFEIVSVLDKPSGSGNDMWTYGLQLTDMVSAVYPYRCVLNPDSLWKVRNLFIASGIDVPKKKLNVDPNKIIGRKVGGSLIDDEYEGKMKSVIDSVFPESEIKDSEQAKKDKKKSKAKAAEPAPAAAKTKEKDTKKGKGKKGKVKDSDLEEIEVEDL